MRLVAISDTHEKEELVYLPDGDVLIHCGDWTNQGTIKAMTKFLDWFSSQPHAHKVFISGNHEVGLSGGGMRDRKIDLIQSYTNDHLIYLEHSEVVINEVKFFGSPYTPEFYNWEWNLPRGKALADKWKDIPSDVNVLMTHGPPNGILDKAPRGDGEFEHAGCQDLLNRIDELPELQLHCFGHIHHNGYGQKEINGIIFVNAAIMTENYQPTNEPIVIDI